MIALLVALAWSAGMFGAGWLWRGDRAKTAQATQAARDATGQAQAQATARRQEHKQAQAAQAAGDSATTREEKINADYEQRLAAAVAGRDAELGKLRKQWAASATRCLSNDAAAAGQVAEEDRLRRASAARIVRATELAQSERDEAVDRYVAAARMMEATP